MNVYVHVVTHLEMGWDNVCGVYLSEEGAVRSCFHDNPDDLSLEEMSAQIEDAETEYVIHMKKLEE